MVGVNAKNQGTRIKNTSYDWAVWGKPRVLWFRGSSELKTNPAGKVSILITTGAVGTISGSGPPERRNGGGMKTNSVFTSPRGTSERPRRLKSSGNEECEREQGVFYVDFCS